MQGGALHPTIRGWDSSAAGLGRESQAVGGPEQRPRGKAVWFGGKS